MGEWLLIGGLFLVVIVGMVLYARQVVRRPSEYEQAYEELRRATQEAADEIGQALRPPLEKLAKELASITEAWNRGRRGP